MSQRGVTLLFASLFFLVFAPSVVADSAVATPSLFYLTLVGLLYLATVLLHFSRRYFMTTMKRFRSQVVSESWLFTYLLLRDGLLLVTFIMGFLLLRGELYQTMHLAVPFLPLSLVLLGFVLYLRFVSHDGVGTQLWSGVALLAGLVFYVFPLFFFPGSQPYHWTVVRFSSLLNPQLAQLSLRVSTTLLVLLVLLLFFHYIGSVLSGRGAKKEAHPHHVLLTVVTTIIVLLLFLLLFLVLFSRFTGSFLGG